MKQLVLGGARSGKSREAELRAEACFQSLQTTDKTLIYLATATAFDDEMNDRIEHHQAQRHADWYLIEEPVDIAKVLFDHSEESNCILIDCLTLWLNNCLYKKCWQEKRQEFLSALEQTLAHVFLVSNEVGSGVIPLGSLSREFVDESGRLHQQVASICNEVTLVVAGLPLKLK